MGKTESTTQRKRRLEKKKLKRQEKAAIENDDAKRQRLSKRREQLNSETHTQRQMRLDKDRQRKQQLRASESQEEHDTRIENVFQYMSYRRSAESTEQRAVRLSSLREHNAQVRSQETPDQREARLSASREHNAQVRKAINLQIENFNKTINIFCDKECKICTKRCYPNQVTNYEISLNRPSYLPAELTSKETILVYNRCKKHLTSKKKFGPAKAYWNDLDPGDVPDVIKQLTQPEQRLLSRIIPFVKIVKYDGLFGQYGFKGQAILFAQDIYEFTENLPNILPRSTDSIGMVVITEHLENLNILREYKISRSRVYEALRWLVNNNPLYYDVIVDNDAHILQEDLIRVTEVNNNKAQNNTSTFLDPTTVSTARGATVSNNAYTTINNSMRVLRASWHQGNNQVFNANYAGSQCCAMVLANIVRAAILSPHLWTNNILNINMLEGDTIYCKIRDLSIDNVLVPSIDESGYLEIRHFGAIRDNFMMYTLSFKIQYDKETDLFGCLRDSMNQDFGMTLKEGLTTMFTNHKAGVLIASSKSLGVMNYNSKYYFTDSHACGPKGASASDTHGKACVIECNSLDDLVQVCKRATSSGNIQYTLNYIDVHVTNNITQNNSLQSLQVPPLINSLSQEKENNLQQALQQQPHQGLARSLNDMRVNITCHITQTVPVHTSVMASIDSTQPTEKQVLNVSNNINKITRKTTNNIVNVAHERKAEEFAWFFLLPYGVNGLNQSRQVKISPLDYFQYRILGYDTRFQRNDYLFYALSMFEYHRVKATISACCKKVEGQDGKVDDVHLYLKNLRGSASYWRTALNELLAQIRCLGPPTYFLTFSCNDINWLDMRKALLIADGRPMDDPQDLDRLATQRLIEQYPVIVSRHFMYRFNALMKLMLNNNQILNGRIKDYWWRIEFQKRGSPHVHMVVWVEGHASFDTEEGLHQLNQVCSCDLPPETSELHDLVKNNQLHKHTKTCYKNDTKSATCRFGFPRRECAETHIVAHSSEEFISNGGRICILKRGPEAGWVNNYNPTLLKVWNANMDIQPCGTNEAIAFYIAKYVSKSEPTQLDAGVAQAIREIQREETDISRKLFKVCMRILRERQVSACECAYRLCHLNFKDSSRKCTFLNTRKPEQRYRVLKFDSNGSATGYCSNIFERYEKRPNQHLHYDLNNMCLLEFAMLFEPHYAKANQDLEECLDMFEPERQTRHRLIRLNDNSKIVIRNTPAVVRVPYFVAASDPENYYYSLLLQYVPYRHENELIEDYDTARDAFLARESDLRATNARLDTFRETDSLRMLLIRFMPLRS